MIRVPPYITTRSNGPMVSWSYVDGIKFIDNQGNLLRKKLARKLYSSKQQTLLTARTQQRRFSCMNKQ